MWNWKTNDNINISFRCQISIVLSIIQKSYVLSECNECKNKIIPKFIFRLLVDCLEDKFSFGQPKYNQFIVLLIFNDVIILRARRSHHPSLFDLVGSEAFPAWWTLKSMRMARQWAIGLFSLVYWTQKSLERS